MKCKTSSWACAYHACMSDDCQKHEVLKNHPGFGQGKCENLNAANRNSQHPAYNPQPATCNL